MRTPGTPEKTTLKILVAGGSGFIGSRLISRLTEENSQDGKQLKEIFCLTRDPQSIKEMFSKEVKLVKADVSDHRALSNAMPRKIDVAYYLVHSMEGRSKDWKRFSERDRVAAMNFAEVATECGVKRIIFLSGLVDPGNDDKKLSEHMRSRLEVGEILRKYSTSKVTIFRAAVILGQGSGSFQMLQFLVERLPVMVCPRWVLSKCQPIAVEDVVEYLAKSIEVTETEGKTFDIGGPEIFTYYGMMKRYAEIINKSVRIIIIPFLTPRLSSYWVDLVTPLKASLARPLIDSLKHDAIMQDDSVRKLIPIKLKSFSEAIHLARNNNLFRRQQHSLIKGRSNQNISNKYLIVCLVALAAIGSLYYIINGSPEIYGSIWTLFFALWYIATLFSLYFLRFGARLGALTAGILGWLSLAFYILGVIQSILETSTIISLSDVTITILNLIGSGVAAIVIVTSHNLFHTFQ